MERRHSEAGRRLAVLLGLFVLLVACALFGFTIGTRPVTLTTTWDSLFHFDPQSSDHLLVRNLRIPRTLLAIIVGAALGVAGTVMQALTRNPLSDPGILGINAGASVAIVIAITLLGFSDVTFYMAFGVIGAGLAGTAVYLLGNVGAKDSQLRVVLAGAAVSVVLMSIAQIVLINSADQVFDQYRNWSVGSLQGRGYSVFLPVGGLTLIGLALAFSLASALDTAALGSDLSKALGANPVRVWSLAAISIIFLSGAATAAAGPIAFVGLTAPHIARLLAGPGHRWLLPYSMVVAAILVTIADTLGRIIAPPGEVSVGIMIGLFGGPFFILLVRRNRMSQL
ncbi:iron ABC transporter permease [Ochrobactrum sp. GPK 3]|uniref:FecCD family ABC transporter permease n=1 Tax=Brucella sp. 22210 TaxID=3453892 RepID=UPI0031385BB4